MFHASKAQAELLGQRAKLVNSYNALLEEFSAKELQSVGNYNVGALIGKGSFGRVYLASHKFIRASKVVLKQAKKDEANLAREIHHHRQFIHPHIARLYEVIVTETSVWLVLEYCPGDELYHYLTKHGPIEPATVQKIFTQLVAAVSYVHGKSCVHRDLKLENILLDKNDNVKLCDFGFTREYEGKSSYLQTWCGTVCYSAPEMLKGEKYAGEKVDVWSLGIILYALLCGELPFDEDDETATKACILRDEPKYPDSMPSGAKDLISALLSKRPILRPSLAEILMNPWLADHAPQQQAILKLPPSLPFASNIELETLDQMRAAGMDNEVIKDHVLSQRCDALTGWWALLLERNERKEVRRQRRRKQRELEGRVSRRISGASQMMLDTVIKESEEEKTKPPGDDGLAQPRGRELDRRNGSTISPLQTPAPPSEARTDSNGSPRAPYRPQARPAVTAKRRSQYTTGDSKRQNSNLQMVVNDPALYITNPGSKAAKRRYQQPLLDHLASLKQWFRVPGKQKNPINSLLNHTQATAPATSDQHANHTSHPLSSATLRPLNATSGPLAPLPLRSAQPSRPTVTTRVSGSSQRRPSSHSSSPVTPQSSFYRRNTAPNMRGRASTSSSISSAPSVHGQRPSQSKRSSASSSTIGSPSLSGSSLAQRRNSSKRSVKVLAAPPPGSTLSPHAMRVVKTPAHLAVSEANAAFSNVAPPSPGLLFAKRKRTPFRGPTIGTGLHGPRRRSEPSGAPGSRSGSAHGRHAGEVPIQEEDEDEVEEVDYFSPVTAPGEFITSEDHFPGK